MAVEGLGSAELERSFSRTRELCRQLGDPPELFPVLYGLAAYQQGRAEHQAALALSEQLLTLAEHSADSALLLPAHMLRGAGLLYMGRPVAARTNCERALAVHDPIAHRTLADLYGLDPTVPNGIHLAMALWLLGYPDQGVQQANEAFQLARDRAHPLSIAMACMGLGILYQHRREAAATLQQGEALLTLSHEHGIPTPVGGGNPLVGWARAEQGQAVEGIAQMRLGLQLHTDKQPLSLSFWMSLLMDAYRRTGQVEEGLALVQEGLGLVERTEERFFEAELYRLQGELLLQQSPHEPSDGEAALAKALAVACGQEAKSWELRAATSLARLWQQQGKTTEAHDLLVPVYNWFTEGFDTADLKDAKSLLNALSKEQ